MSNFNILYTGIIQINKGYPSFHVITWNRDPLTRTVTDKDIGNYTSNLRSLINLKDFVTFEDVNRMKIESENMFKQWPFTVHNKGGEFLLKPDPFNILE